MGETDGGDADGWEDRQYSTERDLEGTGVMYDCVSIWISRWIQAGHGLNDGLDANLTWRYGMTEAFDLPLHEVISKSREINGGWNFMLIICACTV